MIDWLWLIVTFVLGAYVGNRQSKNDIPKRIEHLQETVKRNEEDLKYYKNLCKWHTEQMAELRKKVNND